MFKTCHSGVREDGGFMGSKVCILGAPSLNKSKRECFLNFYKNMRPCCWDFTRDLDGALTSEPSKV